MPESSAQIWLSLEAQAQAAVLLSGAGRLHALNAPVLGCQLPERCSGLSCSTAVLRGACPCCRSPTSAHGSAAGCSLLACAIPRGGRGLGISRGEQLPCTKLGRSCCDVKASEGFVSPPEAFSQQLSRPTNRSGHKTHRPAASRLATPAGFTLLEARSLGTGVSGM